MAGPLIVPGFSDFSQWNYFRLDAEPCRYEGIEDARDRREQPRQGNAFVATSHPPVYSLLRMLEELDNLTQSRFVFFSQLLGKTVQSADAVRPPARARASGA